MKGMRVRLVIPCVALIAGIAIGAVGALFYARLQPRDSASATSSNAALSGLSTADLGEKLLGGVGRTFVADARTAHLSDGVTFYDTPVRYGFSLCRVNAVGVSPGVVRRFLPAQAPEKRRDWNDELTIQRRYAIVTSPTGPELSDADHDRTCAAFRDFKHTFIESSLNAAERGAYLLDLILKASRSTAPMPIHISCLTVKSPKSIHPCDGRALLKQLSLKQLIQVQTPSEKMLEHAWEREDDLFIDSPEPRRGVFIRIANSDRFGKLRQDAGDIRSVKITVDNACCD